MSVIETPALTERNRTSFAVALARAIQDLIDGLGMWRLWLALAWEDIRTTYRRSLFGIAWVTLSFAAFIVVKLFIFIPLMGNINQGYYTKYLLLGFFIWQFLSVEVTTAPMGFVSAEGWIKNDPLPLSVYVYQAIARSLFNFFLTSLVVIVMLIAFRHPLTLTALLVVPAIGLFIVNALWVRLFLGVICTRHRDLVHLIQTVMRVTFFLSPVFWLPEQMGRAADYLWWNPFWHFIAILRDPVLTGDAVAASWIFVGVVTAIGWALALVTFALFRRRIVFWF